MKLLFKGWVSFGILTMATPIMSVQSLIPKIPLERYDCKCALTYNIYKANIDLDRYKLLVIKFNNESIKLTPTLLMNYGLLYRLIFFHTNQISGFEGN